MPDPYYDWREFGSCYRQGLDGWFTDDRERTDPRPEGRSDEDELFGLAICNECMVQAECLTFALDTNQRYGIWGGLTSQQRRALMHQVTQDEADPDLPGEVVAVMVEESVPVEMLVEGGSDFSPCVPDELHSTGAGEDVAAQ